MANQATFNQGYDVKTTSPSHPKKGANAILNNPVSQTRALLHVTAIETNLSLSGSTGQSVLTRDFYPRNFVQPAFTIICIAPGQEALGKIAEFVHDAQRDSVRTGQVMGLSIPRGGLKHTSDGMRGVRSALNATGYIRTMPRSHKRHDPAPVYQFEFVIASMKDGIFKDTPYKAYKLAKWSDIVDDIIKKNLVKAPEVLPPVSEPYLDQSSVFNSPGLTGH
jgi:hypothetical protein